MGIHIEKYHTDSEFCAVCAVCGYNEDRERTAWQVDQSDQTSLKSAKLFFSSGHSDFFQVENHQKKKGKFHIKQCEQCDQTLNTWTEKKKHMDDVHGGKWHVR